MIPPLQKSVKTDRPIPKMKVGFHFREGDMKKSALGIAMSALLLAGGAAFSGDAAAFVDLGISADGRTYVFGEYGKTDGDFRGYAEIYTVDIERNDFVSGGIFRARPTAGTASKSGREVFDELREKSQWWLRKYGCTPVTSEQVLYFSDGRTPGDSEIIFKDEEGSTVEQSIFYHIRLIKSVEGRGSDLHSSFFITVEKADENGHIVSRNIIGSPDVKRKGVTGYKIEKIFADPRWRNLVFVVEKTVEDSSGTSVRYMVETVRL